MNYPAAELRGIKMNFYLIDPDAEHRGILLIKITKLFKEHVYVFFCNTLYIHSNGAFQNGAKPLGPELEAEGQHVLVFYCSAHMHLFEKPLNGPFFGHLTKKDIHMLLLRTLGRVFGNERSIS